MSTATFHRLTADEYLAIERAAVSKSEFFDGEMTPMSGGSEPHAFISGNVFLALKLQLKRPGLRVYGSDMRIRTSEGLYTYPDVCVLAEERQFDGDRHDVLTNPALIVEVLSPSTEAYDRGLKFRRYQQIDSLRTYILVSQHHPCVEVFSKQSDGRWISTLVRSGLIEIPFPACQIDIIEVYADVDFRLAEQPTE